MDNTVSARRLRKSMLKNTNVNIDNIGISDLDIKRKIKEHEVEENNEIIENNKKNKINFKTKFFIRFFIAINIVFLCLVCKLMFKEQILNNKYAMYIVNEYNKDYTKEGILEKLEEYSKSVYDTGKYIIPESFANYISLKYVSYLKPKIVNLCIKDEVVNVINNNFLKNDQNEEENLESNNENTGVGGGEPYSEAKLEEIASAISIMDNDVNEILSKNISIILPVKGTITSRYGAREQIFENVNPYHTGIDIANKLNTEIVSATDGVITKTEKMNKYYGNNIEIEKDGVIFKYAHLNKINVKKGDSIKQGEVIGLMGSTGMSTGSHLHFEIKINNRTIDPEKIIKFD